MDDATAFESLLVELSARFTDVVTDRLDDEIENALRLLVEALGTDRSTLFELERDSKSLRPTHSWARAEIEPTSTAIDMPLEVPWYHSKLARGEAIVARRLPDDLPEDAVGEREYVSRVGMKSNLTVPIAVGGRFFCALATGTFRDYNSWPEPSLARVRVVGQILANALHRRRATGELRASLAQVRELKDRLEAENVYLREEVRATHDFEEIVGRSPALGQALGQVSVVAPTDSTVLLLGETGTGKELLARALHERSPRRARPMVRVNCAAIPAALMESELFGHEKGAFTGALATKVGRFELADGSTLFLDEVGDMALEVQAKVLRVLQEGEFERLGSNRTHKVDVRVVAATNHDLGRDMDEGRFRADLYYRLGVFVIQVPPLRERREDIPLLVWSIIQRRGRTMGRRIERVPEGVMRALQDYSWRGNVRELQNVIERALILSPGPTLQLAEVLAPTSGAGAATIAPRPDRFDDAAREHIRGVLDRCGWRINGRGNAAEILGVNPSTLRSRLKRLGLTREASPH